MNAMPLALGVPRDDQLGGMAARLIDIAECVAQEAEMATGAMRGLVEQAGRVESLAAALDAAAGAIEEGVRAQAVALAAARADLATNRPVIDALETSIANVAAISDMMAAIAKESHTLSLNARIEAARVGSGTSAFAAVAAEMSTLAGRSKRATGQIGQQSADIAASIRVANHVAIGYGALVHEQDLILAKALEQRRRPARHLAGDGGDHHRHRAHRRWHRLRDRPRRRRRGRGQGARPPTGEAAPRLSRARAIGTFANV